MLQQIVAVVPAFIEAALVRGMTLAFTHCIAVARAVGSDRRVEDRIAVRSTIRAALFERGTPIVVARRGDVLTVLGGITSTSVDGEDSQTQDSGYAYNSLHDLAHLPMAKGKIQGVKQLTCPWPVASAIAPASAPEQV